MNNKLIFGIGLLLGGAIGVISVWKHLDAKYKKIADEEIESVKETFSSFNHVDMLDHSSIHPDGIAKESHFPKPNLSDYMDILSKNGYHANNKVEAKVTKEAPYVISPDAFGEMDDYSRISLTYYADGVLADEDDEIIDDIDISVGKESLKHFGDYEDDSVFVRNDTRKCDYEILLDLRKYSDVLKQKPRKMEG